MKNIIHNTFSYGIVYVYSIPGLHHEGRLKIGSATVNSSSPTNDEIYNAAHERIQQQTKTADIPYKLEYAVLAVTKNGVYFSDYDVHEILKRSGYARKSENTNNSHSEWFEISIDIAKNAINAAKEGRASLTISERATAMHESFPFRPNQLDAIDKTTKAIKQNRKHFLWNAKMRFGKTSAAMQVAKENGMKKVLIVTHRPSVSADWFDDFSKVFAGTEYQYASKTRGEHIDTLINGNMPFVYFASLQDLRLSRRVVSDETSNSHALGFDKNEEVFDTLWDMVIVDEAHEGTQSSLGDVTLSKISTNFTLRLSGTPFNILHKHEESEIYTWDYVMEQEAKLNWDEMHPGVPNPYAELPSLSMFTYDIDKFANHIGNLGSFVDALDGAFKFHEFFRVHKDNEGNDLAEFVHKEMVNKFLDLLVDETVKTRFPYSTQEYRDHNKHSLWLLPNRVKVIEAMEKLLNEHTVFGSNSFGIVNISGKSHDDEEDKDAKERVSNAIKHHEYTITLTGQRLTTGASIPQWTAVFMMSDTSSATTYLQTAFRCQTPARIDGKVKTHGYVFDFAPDRTLRLIAEAIELNHKSGKTNTPEQRKAMTDFLNFCPILASDGGAMIPYDVGGMLKQLKKAIIERVSRNGFDDPKLYNDELLQLNELEINKFNDLRAIVGTSSSEKTNEITVNELGMNNLETQKAEDAERKKKLKKQLTDEEKEALKKLKEAREQKKSAISILRAVSIRMPMLVYGADISIREDITLEKFIDIVDDESWLEFMPTGLTKETFREFTKYYDEEVFQGVAHSIRARAFDYDELPPTERVQAIAEIFSTFKNPDKETVLTPWHVVNMQISNTLGGYDFSGGVIDKTGKPEWKTTDYTSEIWSNEDTKILEINAKSGLYPLLAAYNLYSRQLIKQKKPEEEVYKQLWHSVLENNIYIICKSPMAKTITQRTLAGYSKTNMNIVYINDLINKMRKLDVYEEYDLLSELIDKFDIGAEDMKFTAVIGNPPYQVNDNGVRDDGSANASASPIYNLFVEEAKKISRMQSLIIPARWATGAGKGLGSFTKTMINDQHIKTFVLHTNSRDVFPTVDIKGGVCYFLRDDDYSGKTNITIHTATSSKSFEGELNSNNTGTFIPYLEMVTILAKIKQKTNDFEKNNIQSITSVRKPYGLSTDFFKNQSKYGLPPVDDVLKLSDDIEIVGLENAKRMSKFVRKEYPITIGKKDINTWKVFMPYAYGTGEFGEVGGRPMVGTPNQICTETFLRIGSFQSSFEAESLLKYYKTKFFRALVGILKTTQHATTTFGYVPLQNFTQESDIIWNSSISDIDKQLYKKYNFSEEEINFIEVQVKPME